MAHPSFEDARAGRYRQWLGAVPAAMVWAARQSLPLLGHRPRRDAPPSRGGRPGRGAHRLGLSHSTVKHHLANARSKVGAATTPQLVGILASRLPEPEGAAKTDEQQSAGL